MLASLVARARVRLDQLLVERGLVPSRARAQSVILAGLVRVEGEVADKAGKAVAPDAAVEIVAAEHPWVSRGGVKLAAALDAFAISPSGKRCLDVGASTGGFTHVLLERGASRVVALDVGRGQLDWSLRQDPRVVVMEGINARFLTPGEVPGPFDLVSVDVSFISLRLVLPALVPVLAEDGDLVALVKPQFEAGRAEIGKKGLVRDAAVHARVIARVTELAAAAGFVRVGMTPSPITGTTGNQEFFLHLKAARDMDAAERGAHD